MGMSKRYKTALARLDPGRRYGAREACALVKESATAGFDETVEVAIRLGVDPRQADQIVRGTVVLPHGTGKAVRVLALAQGEKAREAQEAGADYVGYEDYIEKLQSGWLDVDRIVATPDVMPKVGRLGPILGPRGLMPNPKSGTVTLDISRAVREMKAGKIEFRVDKTGNIHAPVGKASFAAEALAENIRIFMEMIVRARPASAKGIYLRSVTVSSTMGPAIPLDSGQFGGK